MNPNATKDTPPGDLLASFNGQSLKTIILFTLVVHALLLIATSGPYLWRMATGADTSKMTEAERMELAVKETTSAMRRIAEEHGLKPQDLGSRFAAPQTAAPAAGAKEEPKPESAPEPKAEPAATEPAAPEKPESEIEKELKTAVPGPAVPVDEDLFK